MAKFVLLEGSAEGKITARELMMEACRVVLKENALVKLGEEKTVKRIEETYQVLKRAVKNIKK